MADRDLQAKRRRVLAMIVALIGLPALVSPGPKAKLELTTARISMLLEAGPVRFQTFVPDSAQAPRLILSIGGFGR